MGMVHEKYRGKKTCATVPLKSSKQQKTPGGKKYIILSQKYAGNCRSETLKMRKFKKNYDSGIAKLRSNILLKVAELRLRKFFRKVAEMRLRTPKKVAPAHFGSYLVEQAFVGNCDARFKILKNFPINFNLALRSVSNPL